MFSCYSLIDKKPFLRYDELCPTCSGLLYSGYADRRIIEKWLREIREKTHNLKALDDEFIKNFSPIIDLFKPGVYIVSIIEHQPTDGGNNASFFDKALTNLGIEDCDNFFETVDEETATMVRDEIKRLCRPKLFWHQFGRRYEPHGLPNRNFGTRPEFLYPTQPKSLLQENTVEKYIDMIQKGKRPFGVAYYFSGCMSLLLDGHHKATAYHRCKLPIPCLTILRLTLGEMLSESAALKYYYCFSEQSVTLAKKNIPTEILEEEIEYFINRPDWDNISKIPLDVAKQYNKLLKTDDYLEL